MSETQNLFGDQSGEVPTSKDAMSAFIKSVRLRRTDDAVLWMLFLWQRPQDRERIKLRILLESGEDNLSLNVLEQISEWYGSPRRKLLEAAVTEVIRLCATRNWWAQHDGRQYIYAWREAEMFAPSFKRYGLAELFEVMHTAIVKKSMTKGLAAFNALYGRRDFQPKVLASRLLDWSEKYGGQQAQRLASVFDRHVSRLWMDGNISGQAYYVLIHGEFGEQVCPEVGEGQVDGALLYARERLKAGITVPSHALDGLHTQSGSDKRFAGVVKFMSGCCRAYEHYGRLSPADQWLPSFMGLPEKHTLIQHGLKTTKSGEK